MSNIAIRCDGLGKQYKIGKAEQHRMFRDAFVDAVGKPLRVVRSIARRGQKKTTNGDGTIWALDDVSFEVKHGEVVGIIGRNGSGKSTLLKILSRITEPTKGEVTINGRVASLLEVGTGFHPELTGRENIFLNGTILGMKKREISAKFDEIVAFAEIEKFLDTPVKRYSSGMYVRLAFAVAAHLEPEILLVDEVLAVGDAQFQKKCLGKMRDVAQQGRTVLFVSHDIGAVSRLCETGVVLDSGKVILDGSIHEAVDYYYNALLNISDRGDIESPHVLYNLPEELQTSDFSINRIEALDIDGTPKPVIGTWDDLVLRIWYSCCEYVQRGSVVLELATITGSKLLMVSNQLTSTHVTFEPGKHFIECVIKKLPLAAGQYLLGAGLANTDIKWLWRNQELCNLTIVERDIYDSGMAPNASWSLLALEHDWRLMK